MPAPRTPGLHLSGLLKYVAEKSRITAYLEQISEEEFPLRWLMGHAWEEFAVSLYREILWQPGEANDPVIMTCDWLSLLKDAGLPCVEEFKFNRAKKYTGADLIKRKWLWMCQGAGYCLGYGCDIVRWHVLSAMEWPDPVYTRYLVGFSAKELAEMQTMIEVNRDAAVAAGYGE
jgi:hypothetical protein